MGSKTIVGERVRYTGVAIILHWAITIFILLNLFVGWRMGGLKGMAQFKAFQLHKSFGITVLALSVLRLAWRLTHRAPPYPVGMGAVQRVLANALHGLLYVLMIAMPLTGWVIVSASQLNIPTLLYGTVPWPHLGFVHDLGMAERKAIDDTIGSVHAYLAWSMAVLVAGHVLAALKHQWIDRDGLIGRMNPFGSRPSIERTVL